jgi:Fic-DOC domain mobile mystery protein B
VNAIAEPAGTTPLDPGEVDGLLPAWVTTREDLNRAEAAGIARAVAQSRWYRMSRSDLLDDLEVRRLHRAMFQDVWAWAGKYRTTERNIGIRPDAISVAVVDLMKDSSLWFENGSTDENGARLHHQLVVIHPFPNGNGRLARAFTDLVLLSSGMSAFTWGSLRARGDVRREYLQALRRADAGDLEPLIEFVRT